MLAAGCGGASSEGFDVSAPAGWKDQTGLTTRRSEAKVEALWQSPDASIVVGARQAPARRLARRRHEGRPGEDAAEWPSAEIGAVSPTTLDGAPAARFDLTRTGARARQLGAIHGDHVYLITFTAKPGAFERRLASLDGLLRSWRWS